MHTFQDHSRVWCTASSRARSLWCVCVIAMSLPAIGVCQKLRVSDPEKSIVVDREVLLRDVLLVPKSITQMPDGGFVVGGVRGVASAIATNARGEILWKYEELRDKQIKSPFQSQFNDVVPLANGRVLLCGEKTTTGHTGLVTILDSGGRVIEQRIELPTVDPTLIHSGFHHCLRWEDGIAMTGFANDGKRAYLWIVKLDLTGAKKSEVLVDAAAPVKSADITKQSLVFFSYIDSFQTNVIGVNSRGDVIARRRIDGSAFLQLRSIEPTQTIKLISYRLGHAPELYTLNQKLEDAHSPREIINFDAKNGIGYLLPDGSLALFGRLNNAAVAWIAEAGESYATAELDSRFKSFVVNSAVPLSAKQFVTVRNSVSVNASDQGLVMSWVTLK
jgi:hypothetical protein